MGPVSHNMRETSIALWLERKSSGYIRVLQDHPPNNQPWAHNL